MDRVENLMHEVRGYHTDVTGLVITLELRVRSLERRISILITVLLILIFSVIGFAARAVL